MSLLTHWKKEKNYEEGVMLLELYQKNHSLLPALKQGKSPINELYLEQAINKISPSVMKKKKRAYQKGTQPNGEYLYARLKELYVFKSVHRRKFFSARTDKGRAKVNQELIKFRKEIWDLQQKITYFEKQGDLPEIPDTPPKQMVLPHGKIELMKSLYNTRSSISKAKKNKALAYAAGEKKKMKKYEVKLKLLESNLIQIERQIQNSK